MLRVSELGVNGKEVSCACRGEQVVLWLASVLCRREVPDLGCSMEGRPLGCPGLGRDGDSHRAVSGAVSSLAGRSLRSSLNILGILEVPRKLKPISIQFLKND